MQQPVDWSQASGAAWQKLQVLKRPAGAKHLSLGAFSHTEIGLSNNNRKSPALPMRSSLTPEVANEYFGVAVVRRVNVRALHSVLPPSSEHLTTFVGSALRMGCFRSQGLMTCSLQGASVDSNAVLDRPLYWEKGSSSWTMGRRDTHRLICF